VTGCYQIRDEAFGLCLIGAPTAAAAMRAFLWRKVQAALQPGDYKIADYHDGSASVLFRGFECRSYQAVAAS
jgi:hypothetical protein